MKSHIHKIFLSLITLLVMTALYSCSDADLADDGGTDKEYIYNAYGEITFVGENGYFEITRDDKALLRVMEYNGIKEVAKGERVSFKYSILPGKGNYKSEYYSNLQQVYDIKVLVFNSIHSPSIIRESFILENFPHRNDSLGYDLIRVQNAAFSGNYINIEFEYFRYPGGAEHLVNLVWDDTRNPQDSVFLELRHNAMGEIASEDNEVVSSTGIASFKLSDLIPKGQNGIDIKLKSNLDREEDGLGEYFETEKYHKGTFIPFAKTRTNLAGGKLMPFWESDTTFVK